MSVLEDMPISDELLAWAIKRVGEQGEKYKIVPWTPLNFIAMNILIHHAFDKLKELGIPHSGRADSTAVTGDE